MQTFVFGAIVVCLSQICFVSCGGGAANATTVAGAAETTAAPQPPPTTVAAAATTLAHAVESEYRSLQTKTNLDQPVFFYKDANGALMSSAVSCVNNYLAHAQGCMGVNEQN